jgi:hypothetical protein
VSPVSLHHPPGASQRSRANRRRGPSGAEAKDALTRRHHTLGDVAAGVPAAHGGAGSATDQHLIRLVPAARTTAYSSPAPSCMRWSCRLGRMLALRPRYLPSTRWTAGTAIRCGRAGRGTSAVNRQRHPLERRLHGGEFMAVNVGFGSNLAIRPDGLAARELSFKSMMPVSRRKHSSILANCCS